MLRQLEGDDLFQPGASLDIDDEAHNVTRTRLHVEVTRWMGKMASGVSLGTSHLATHEYVLHHQTSIEQVYQFMGFMTGVSLAFGAVGKRLNGLASRWDGTQAEPETVSNSDMDS